MKDQHNIHVLVTCGGGLQGLTLYKWLSQIESLVSHLFDIHEENIGRYFYDHFFQSSPVRSEQQYERELYDYCRGHGIGLIVPATQYDLLFLSRRKKIFEEQLQCHIAVPEEPWVQTLINKKAAKSFLISNGFPVEEERDPSNAGHYPIMGKPMRGWGGKGAVVLKDPADFLAYRNKVDDYLWTAYVEGFKEYSIDFAVNHQGKISSLMSRERKLVAGGFTWISQSARLPNNYKALIEKAFSKASLSGIYNLQYISLSSGDMFTDLNPRIGTSALGWGTYNPICHFLDLHSYNEVMPDEWKVIRYLEEKWIVAGGAITGDVRFQNALRRARAEGKKEGLKEVAERLRLEGLSVDQIRQITGLPEENIRVW